MTESIAVFKTDKKLKNVLWKIITDNEDYTWRSDLSKIEVIDETNFIEYTKKGFKTHFQITKKETNKLYAFRLENENMTGTWTGTFKENDQEVILTLKEEIHIKNFLLKPLAKTYLKKMQKNYLSDLEKQLNTII